MHLESFPRYRMGRGGLVAALAMVGFVAAQSAHALDVGYYEMCDGGGRASQATPITAAGHTPVNLTDLTPADLASVDVLMVNNCDNFLYATEFLDHVADLEAAVAAGLILVLHDRYVTPAESILPGGATFDIVRADSGPETSQIDVLDGGTSITDGSGPGGSIDDTTLDGGCLSSHGFSVAGSLPGDARLILSRSDPSEIVSFVYGYGQGAVLYSTIPLDFYLDGATCVIGPAIRNTYTPNVVHYAAGLASDACGNGTIEGGEACDEGAGNGSDSCCSFDCNIRPAGAECRGPAGACDIAESCDGVASTCPADQVEPASTECRAAADACDVAESCTGTEVDCPADEVLPDTDADTLCDLIDNCDQAANPGQEDDDGDDQGNACDPCNNIVPTTQAAPTKIVVSKLGSPAGNEKLVVSAQFESVPVAPTLDAVQNGVRVLLEKTGPSPILLDATLPGVAYDPVTRVGWKVSGSGRTFRYINREASPAFGITSVVIRQTAALGVIKVKVKAKNSAFTVDPAETPLKFTVALDPPTAETGQCGETSFSAAQCSFNASQSKVLCQ